jgi:hypothetical protein
MPLQCEVLPISARSTREILVCVSGRESRACDARVRASVGGCSPRGSSAEHVLHAHQLRNLGLCGRIAAQLIGDDLARHGVRAQHTLEETFGRGFVAPLL